MKLKLGKKKHPLRDARIAFQDQVDYWDTRMFYGDPLFDQWMVDALEASKEGLLALDKLETAGAYTGKDEVISKTPTSYKTVKITVEKAWENEWRVEYLLDNRIRMSQGNFEGATKTEAFEAAKAALNQRKVTAETVFTLA